MISVTISGLDDLRGSVLALPDKIRDTLAIDAAGEEFATLLRAVTPPGYNRQLSRSVVYESSEDSVTVGYEEGVETAGGPDYESVTRPKTKGSSVLRTSRAWVRVDALESVLADTFERQGERLAEGLAERAASGIS